MVADALKLGLAPGLAVEPAEVTEVVELLVGLRRGLARLTIRCGLAAVLEAEVREAPGVDELEWFVEPPQPVRTTVTNSAPARAKRQSTAEPIGATLR